MKRLVKMYLKERKFKKFIKNNNDLIILLSESKDGYAERHDIVIKKR